MKEREIRERINGFIEGFDRRVIELVKKGMRNVVLPATLGVGLALGSGCGDDRSVETPGTKQPAGQNDRGVLDPQPEYAAPFPDGGAVALYAAPYPGSDAGAPDPQPEYAAPFPDGGAVALYSAQFPDAGDAGAPDPQPEYAAPFPDRGAVALYSAQFPDAGEAGAMPQPLYGAGFPDEDNA